MKIVYIEKDLFWRHNKGFFPQEKPLKTGILSKRLYLLTI